MLRTAGRRVVLVAVGALALSTAPRSARGAPPPPDGPLLLIGGTIFVSPDGPPIERGTVVVRGGTIAGLGGADDLAVPPDAREIDCEGLFVTAAFQNSHVHFTEEKWQGAAELPAQRLETQLQEMFTRYGFTTVFETASFAENTLALRERIESGEVGGPRILTAGYALYPHDGVPFYLRDSMSQEDVARLRTPASAAAAVREVERNLGLGADAVKLFAVSWMGRGATRSMDLDVARAAVAAAHERGRIVYAHPSNTEGLKIALAAGVDVLAHAVEDRRGWKPQLTRGMIDRRVALVPTLMLFDRDRFLWDILDGVGEFARAGGQILFGTDVGFLPVYDPKDEYLLMAAAGLDPMQVLASLTTAPAERLGEAARRGRIQPGMDADLVILAADPRNSVLAFTRVRTTIRGGRVLYEGPAPP